MSKERLKEMQHMIGMFDGDVEITLFGHKINSEYVMGEIKWLYQRVQELEELKNAFDDLDSDYIDLQEQNKRYREALEWYSENSPHGNIADEALEGESDA